MKLDDLRNALETAGLGRLTAYLDQLTLPAIRIESNPAEDQELPVGASKLGGRPDLPAGAAWPMRGNSPLGFLAQFRLADVAPFDLECLLPRSGMLSFFYDFAGAPWGLETIDRGGWQVLYFTDLTTSTARADWPESLSNLFRLPAQYPAFSLQLIATWEPQWVLPHGQFTIDELAKYRDIVRAQWQAGLSGEEDEEEEDAFEYAASQHQLLGVDYGRMPWECECLAGQHATPDFEDLRFKAVSGLGEQVQADVKQACERWQLLFQLGNVSGLPFPEGYEDEDDPVWRLSELCDLWARGGLMYFWIERDRLAQHEFSNVWMLGASQL